MSGAIFSTGSTLAQFEIRNYGDGVVDESLPCVVWVDRANPLRAPKDGIGCSCSGPFFPIRLLPDDLEFEFTTDASIGSTPAVCACMGGFIE